MEQYNPYSLLYAICSAESKKHIYIFVHIILLALFNLYAMYTLELSSIFTSSNVTHVIIVYKITASKPKALQWIAREAPSACMYRNRRQRIRSFKMVAETSDENQFSYFYVLNPFLKLTRPDRPTRPTSGEKLLSFSMPRICQSSCKCMTSILGYNSSD